MKPIRLILAAAVLAAAAACNARSVTAPEHPGAARKPSADQSSGTASTNGAPTAPVPSDTTGKSQVVGSGT